MAGYVKKMAVIKQLKGGFSADGGLLSGLIKLETYAGYLKAEVSLINFAPLSEGRYVFGLSDGENVLIFEDVSKEFESPFNSQSGFAFVVCFCKGQAFPIASAYCGSGAGYLTALTEEIKRREEVKPKSGNGAAYDDEAISEVNYYDDKVDKDGQSVFEDNKEEGLLSSGYQDEADIRPVKIEKGEGIGLEVNEVEPEDETVQSEGNDDEDISGGETTQNVGNDDGDLIGGLAGGDFYSRMLPDIEKIFSSYPKDSDLEEVLVGSRFVKIGYGVGQYYAFGVLYVGGNAQYICYGVPSSNPENPPKSLRGFASYIPCKNGGYWMTWQDAKTGVSVEVELG